MPFFIYLANTPSLAFVRLRETHALVQAMMGLALVTVILILLLAISVICTTLEAQ